MAKRHPTKRYRFDCSCGKDPMHGTIATSPAAEEQMLTVLAAGFAKTHSRPGCEPKPVKTSPHNQKASRP
jgi:hypothetical protein